MAFTKKTWADGADGGTPITADELDRMEQGIADGQNEAQVTWATLSDKPSTFPPEIGTTATTAKAGNYAPAVGDVTGLQAILDDFETRISALENPAE